MKICSWCSLQNITYILDHYEDTIKYYRTRRNIEPALYSKQRLLEMPIRNIDAPDRSIEEIILENETVPQDLKPEFQPINLDKEDVALLRDILDNMDEAERWR